MLAYLLRQAAIPQEQQSEVSLHGRRAWVRCLQIGAIRDRLTSDAIDTSATANKTTTFENRLNTSQEFPACIHFMHVGGCACSESCLNDTSIVVLR